MVAYAITHPACLNALPCLSDDEYRIPKENEADTFFVNEVTVSPEWQGYSIGKILFNSIRNFVSSCTCLKQLSLVSVQASDKFWTRVGCFQRAEIVCPVLLSKLCQSYGEEYVFMTATIDK